MSNSWLSLIICTWSQPLSAQSKCTMCCGKSCGDMPEHACTTGRHASGIEAVSSLTGVKSWRQQHRMQIPQREFGGAAMRTGLRIKASPSWELQWADQNLLNQSSQRSWPTTGSCSQGSLKFKTCSVHGCCCFTVGPPERTSTIRTIRPELSAEFSQRHDEQIWHCFCKLLKTPPDAVAVSASKAATLPFTSGGLGLRSAWRLREAAHWASWADTIKMVKARHPDIANIILAAVEARDEVPSVQAVNQSVESLAEIGFVAPLGRVGQGDCCPAKCRGCRPEPAQGGMAGIRVSLGGVQFPGGVLRPTLSNAESALLRSQGGPLASAPFVSFPDESLRSFGTASSPGLSCADCVSHSLFQPVPADVAVLSTSLAIIGRPALLLDAGTQGVPSGERGCENLPRGRWEGPKKRFRAGHGPWCCKPVRHQEARGRC